MKFGKIELTDWTPRSLVGYDYPDLVRYHNSDNVCVVLYTEARYNIIEDVRFYLPLSDLQVHWNEFIYKPNIRWDTEFAKQTVDAFLIKMNNLRAFL